MQQKKLFSGLLLLGMLTAFICPVIAQGTATPAAAGQPAGRIIAARVRGDVSVTIKATNVKTPLTNNAEISQGSIVTTAKEASVVLVFNNGATINLGTESVLDIEQFTQDPFSAAVKMSEMTEEPTTSHTKLNLTRGELVGKVAKLKTAQGSSFNVGTPVGAAGIRGTTFRIVYRPDGTGKAFFSMTTLEGSVEVSLVGSVNAPVTVGDNKEVSVNVDITVNPQTGQVTVTSSTGQTLAVIDAPVGSTQPIADAAQQIAQAVANVVLAPPSAPPPPPPPPPDNPVPGPTTTSNRTTTGDGG